MLTSGSSKPVCSLINLLPMLALRKFVTPGQIQINTFSLGEVIFKMDCKTGQNFTLKVNIFLLLKYFHAVLHIHKPRILIETWFSQFFSVKYFLLNFYKSYGKIHKVEGCDVSLFSYNFRR